MKGWENRHHKMKRENLYEMALETALLVGPFQGSPGTDHGFYNS